MLVGRGRIELPQPKARVLQFPRRRPPAFAESQSAHEPAVCSAPTFAGVRPDCYRRYRPTRAPELSSEARPSLRLLWPPHERRRINLVPERQQDGLVGTVANGHPTLPWPRVGVPRISAPSKPRLSTPAARSTVRVRSLPLADTSLRQWQLGKGGACGAHQHSTVAAASRCACRVRRVAGRLQGRPSPIACAEPLVTRR